MGFLDVILGRNKRQEPNFDLSLLRVDMHSHLIPGIDDGSKSLDESIALLAKFERLGFEKVITTPHIMSDYYKNTPEIINSGLQLVKEAAVNSGLKIEIEAAAEYYFDETLLTKIQNNEKLMTFGDNYLLFEFSMLSKPDQIETLFFELLSRNIKPVLAHYERYTFLFGDIDTAKKWREQGIFIQMNLNSLSGHYGPEVKRTAELLVENNLVDFAATDCHRMEHLMLLERNLHLKQYKLLHYQPLINSQL